MKAIQTKYKGYNFRSRLEARWAVFFDALGIQYEYEKEGFECKRENQESTKWLPDFYLSDLDVHVEVKPRGLASFDYELYLSHLITMAVFHNDGSLPIAVLCGNPYLDEYFFMINKFENMESSRDYFVFADCRKCNGISLIKLESVNDIYYTKSGTLWGNQTGFVEFGNHSCGNNSRLPILDSDRMINAYNAARSARFEHGESPQF